MSNTTLICLEGRDGSGKTEIFRFLVGKARREGKCWVFLSEFSQSDVGMLIRSVLARQRFFSLGGENHLVVAETLLLAADLGHQLECLSPGTDVAIADRGILSLLIYQGQRLLDAGIFPDLQTAVAYVASLLAPLGIRPHNILLTVGESEMIRRLIQRGEIAPSEKDLRFLQAVELGMLNFGSEYSRTLQIIDSERPRDQLAEEVYRRLLRLAKR